MFPICWMQRPGDHVRNHQGTMKNTATARPGPLQGTASEGQNAVLAGAQWHKPLLRSGRLPHEADAEALCARTPHIETHLSARGKQHGVLVN